MKNYEIGENIELCGMLLQISDAREINGCEECGLWNKKKQDCSILYPCIQELKATGIHIYFKRVDGYITERKTRIATELQTKNEKI